MANPPFSLDKWGADLAQDDIFGRFKLGVPPASKGDYAFILHMIASLKPNGTMAVIVPHGVLFRTASEGKIRKSLIEQNLLDCVIGLPANLFFGTSIPTCILVFKKNKNSNDVLFIDASKEYEKGKNQNKLTKEHISKIIQTYESRQDREKYAHLANAKEIEQNEYNLNIPRYVDTLPQEEIIDLESTKLEIQSLEQELKQTQVKMNEYLNELGL